jgi:hypothetical protein
MERGREWHAATGARDKAPTPVSSAHFCQRAGPQFQVRSTKIQESLSNSSSGSDKAAAVLTSHLHSWPDEVLRKLHPGSTIAVPVGA